MPERIKRFLNFLEVERYNSIVARNARLADIHVCARYLVNEQPDCLHTLQPVIGIEFKRGGRIARRARSPARLSPHPLDGIWPAVG